MDEEVKNKWYDLLSGFISKEEVWPMLNEAITALEEKLKTNPETETIVLSILQKRLGGVIDFETWDAIHDSLSQFFGGEEIAFLLYWVANVEDQSSNRMYELDQHATEEVMSFFRVVVGIYGPDLTKAFNLARIDPNNWRTVIRDLYFDVIGQTYNIKLRIKKVNEEELVIEGPPDSILALATELVATLSFPEIQDYISDEIRKSFLDMSNQLTKKRRKRAKG